MVISARKIFPPSNSSGGSGSKSCHRLSSSGNVWEKYKSLPRVCSIVDFQLTLGQNYPWIKASNERHNLVTTLVILHLVYLICLGKPHNSLQLVYRCQEWKKNRARLCARTFRRNNLVVNFLISPYSLPFHSDTSTLCIALLPFFLFEKSIKVMAFTSFPIMWVDIFLGAVCGGMHKLFEEIWGAELSKILLTYSTDGPHQITLKWPEESRCLQLWKINTFLWSICCQKFAAKATFLTILTAQVVCVCV